MRTSPPRLEPRTIRERLELTQEAMARVLMVSFVTVNRWENHHSVPQGISREIYLALARALHRGRFRHRADRDTVLTEANHGLRLYLILDAAYGK